MLYAALGGGVAEASEKKVPWWNPNWGGRVAITVDTTAEGGDIKDAVGGSVVLLRFSQANLPFEHVQEGGADLRFVAADGKTLLPFHVEKWDSLMLEAIVWVHVPEIAAAGSGGRTPLMMYYGNASPDAETGASAEKTYPAEFAAVYHFAERNTVAKDSTSNGNNAASAGSVSEGALIGSGLRLLGGEPIEIPASPSLEWIAGGKWSWSAWVKKSAASENAILLSRRDGERVFRVGLNNDTPFVEVNGQRTTTEVSVVDGAWTRLDVTFDGNELIFYVNAKPAAKLAVSLPAMNTPFLLGGDAGDSTSKRFVGEIDEMQMLSTARSAASVQFDWLAQGGSEAAARLVVVGESEGSGAKKHSDGFLEHVSVFGDIASNMMFDGWIAVGVCILMIFTGWSVAFSKFSILKKIETGNEEFIRFWSAVSSDLTAIDLDDENSDASKSAKGILTPRATKLLKDSTLYHVYRVGASEIRKRIGGGRNTGQGLSARSIQAIRAALDGAVVREQQRLNKGIVTLTISIAGGPYVGLLGTVVGVMITFAIIARSGEVEVNSIAPGIASALLATTMGLVVAIPALFMYSFLNSRIKNILAGMQVFINEFVAKVAEFYPTPAEAAFNRPTQTKAPRSPEEAIELEDSGGSSKSGGSGGSNSSNSSSSPTTSTHPISSISSTLPTQPSTLQ